MSNFSFDPENTLTGLLGKLDPGEIIALGISLCHFVEDESPYSFRGGIWPGNISWDGTQAALGPYEAKGLKEMGPDALEYIAPEQFWNGDMSTASDVYSIGLVLFTALNGGVMPFFEAKPSHTPEERAAALQKRMRGGVMDYPRSACRELGDIILCATDFKVSERYSCPSQLRAALEALPEEAAIPAVAPVIRLKPKEVEAARSYKVDKSFEKTPPERQPKPPKRKPTVNEDMDVREFRKTPRKRHWFVPTLIIVAIVVIIALLIKGCSPDKPNDDFIFEDEPGINAPVSPSPQLPPESEVTPSPEPEVSPDPEVTDEPVERRITMFVDDVTWEEAKASCEAMGGHLATVGSQEELDKIIAMATEKGASFVWLGSYRSEDGTWKNVTGEAMNFSVWDAGEPSAFDSDGTPENYLLLWYRAALGAWTYNDMRNDPISVIPATYSGKVAYVCCFD